MDRFKISVCRFFAGRNLVHVRGVCPRTESELVWAAELRDATDTFECDARNAHEAWFSETPPPMQLQHLLASANLVIFERVVKVGVLLVAAVFLLAITGCIGGSARDLYYGARAIESHGIEGDGSVILAEDRSDELREAIMRARRVQLADAEK